MDIPLTPSTAVIRRESRRRRHVAAQLVARIRCTRPFAGSGGAVFATASVVGVGVVGRAATGAGGGFGAGVATV